MSKNDMVMVPRELVEKAMLACFEAGFGIPHDELRDALSQQHQGEPVAWRVGSQIFQQEHLAKMHSGGVRKPVEPLYTHADPGEVERLRAELEVTAKLYEEGCQATYDFDAMQQQIDDLLRMLRMAWGSDDISAEDCRRIDAALSASADPSAPKCKNKLPCLRPDLCGICEPSAPVEIDERAEFEAHIEETESQWDLMLVRVDAEHKIHGHPRDIGEYAVPETHAAWKAWQVRAALERKP